MNILNEAVAARLSQGGETWLICLMCYETGCFIKTKVMLRQNVKQVMVQALV